MADVSQSIKSLSLSCVCVCVCVTSRTGETLHGRQGGEKVGRQGPSIPSQIEEGRERVEKGERHMLQQEQLVHPDIAVEQGMPGLQHKALCVLLVFLSVCLFCMGRAHPNMFIRIHEIHSEKIQIFIRFGNLDAN